MTREEHIAQLSRNSDWRAALMILTSPFFCSDGRVWNHVDLKRESIDFKTILEDGTWSGGETRLLRIAASLFATEVDVNLWRTFGGLDEEATLLAIHAIESFCGIERGNG